MRKQDAKQLLEAHMKLKPIYPMYGETSLPEHIAWSKAYAAWDSERTRLEMLILAGKAKTVVIWDGAIRTPGKINDNLHRPRGMAADPARASWARITPKNEAHARKLERQRLYREQQRAKKAQAGGTNER